MRIFAFSEHYPSPVKPYFDTQFECFLQAGHSLRIFANEQQGSTVETKVRALGLDRLTEYVPSTLRTIPRHLTSLLVNFASHPIAQLKRASAVYASDLDLKNNILNISRAALLPLERPDLCLVHSLSTATRFGFLQRAYPGVPIGFYYHGGEVAGVPVIPKDEAARAFRSADVVFTNTENSRDHAIGRGCDPGKVVVSPVGFNIDEFTLPPSRPYRTDGVMQLLSIGRMSKEKGFVFALQAVRLLVQKGLTSFRYTFIGGGPEEKVLRQYVADNNLESYVEFAGHVSRDELYARLRTADALVLPSIVWGTWQENQACVVQEAMLMRTPAIVTRTGGVPESTAPSLSPFIAPPEDAAALAASIEAMMSLNSGEIADLGRQCREFAESHYDIRRLNDQIIRAMSQIAAGGRISP